jgi:hypothetical protein
MALSDYVFLCCERGANEGLFAEPFNAASNGVLAGLVRRPKQMRSADNALLIALLLLIGLGSLAFHLLADRASLFADVVPIDVFMLVYFRLCAEPPRRLIGTNGTAFDRLTCGGRYPARQRYARLRRSRLVLSFTLFLPSEPGE